jgi:hypothetical protein
LIVLLLLVLFHFSLRLFFLLFLLFLLLILFRLLLFLLLPLLLQLPVTAYAVPRSLILSTVMIVPIRSSETSVLTIAARHHILESGILHSHRRENLKSYIALTGWAL